MVQPLTTSPEGRLVGVVRSLLAELGGADVRVEMGSSLDRDLGLGSLERVELLMRVEREFGRRLPDQVAQSADKLEDWFRALEAEPGEEESARKRYAIRSPGDAPAAPVDAAPRPSSSIQTTPLSSSSFSIRSRSVPRSATALW